MLLSRLEIINGILIFVLLGVFFLVLESSGYSDNIYLRFFNVIFVFIGINRTVSQKVKSGERGYFRNFKAALITSLIASILAVIGLAVYMTYFKENAAISDLAPSLIMGDQDADLLKYCSALLVEGLISTLLLSFIFMQYWRVTHDLKKPESK